ncbi:MAG: hypothetical protein LBB86_03670 [Oscillospiraceae bacterium]|jgi:hypothetical protein|nr:hypothetical protein [Oscillospiraceae bacterium]
MRRFFKERAMRGIGKSSDKRTEGLRGKYIYRAILCASAAFLALATMQVLFDVPVMPFLVPRQGASGASLTAVFDGNAQKISAVFTKTSLPSITLQRGVPVELSLNLSESEYDSCTKWLTIPDFGVDFETAPGENVIAFIPDQSGVFTMKCWMGNIKSTVTVVESLGFKQQATQTEYASIPSAPGTESAAPSKPASTVIPQLARHYAALVTPRPTEAPVFEKEDKTASIGDWLERQLTPGSADEGAREIRTWTGWVFDRDCVGIDPTKHTKACNLMGSCYESGLGIFEYVRGKAYDTYTAVETFLCFDGASKELTVAFLNALPVEWKNNVTVTVSGYAVNNIPAAEDELLIPETDLSRVTHYLNGIHVTKIEAAFIEGLSTNQLPEPNVVFTQP